VAFIKILRNELIGKKSLILPDFAKSIIDGFKSGYSNGKLKSPEERFDHAVQKSFELYDEMVDDIKKITEEIFEKYFKEFIHFLEENGCLFELNQFLESMQQDIEEADQIDEDNAQESNSLRTSLLNVLNEFESNDFWTLGNIPEKKLNNVRRYPVDPTDEILAIIDTTVFGSAKCGMAFGLRGLYWNNDWTSDNEKNFLTWEEIKESSKNISVIKNDNVFLAPQCSFGLSSCAVKPNDFIKLIQRCLDAVSE
jgi:hypothetical protein